MTQGAATFQVRADSSANLSSSYLLLAMALWLANHHYGGIYHDAWLYAASALHWLDPVAYQRDPFFMFGSQGDFTIFSPLYGFLIKAIGLEHAAMAVVVVSAMTWVVTLWAVVRSLIDDVRASGIALLFCVIHAVSYSPNYTTFVINETFATARILAMPLGLLGLACALNGRYRLAWCLGAIATLLHPLLGIWPLAIIVASRLKDRVLLSGLLLTWMLFFVGVCSGWPEFQRMDPEWLKVISVSTGDVFVGPWGTVRLNEHLFWLSALCLGGRWGRPSARRWYFLTALFSAWALLTSIICSYFFPAQLLIQAQLWRATWIALPLGICALADISTGYLRNADRWLLWLGIAAFLSIWHAYVGYLLLAATLVGNPQAGRIQSLLDRVVSRQRRWVIGVGAALVLILLPNYFQELLLLGDGWGVERWEYLPAFWGFFVAGGAGLGVVVIGTALSWLSRQPGFRYMLVALLALAAFDWDRRPPVTRAWESGAAFASANALAPYVKPGDVVLWPGNLHRIWFDLRTAGYVADRQTIGIVFSRQKTYEMMRRNSRLAIASMADRWPLSILEQSDLLSAFRSKNGVAAPDLDNIHKYDPMKLTDAGIAYLCEDGELDWIISGTRPRAPIVQSIKVGNPWEAGTLYLYDCKRFRTSVGQRSAPLSFGPGLLIH